jgi:hypothetical protein
LRARDCRAFVISGKLSQPDTVTRCNPPPAEIERLVAGFIGSGELAYNQSGLTKPQSSSLHYLSSLRVSTAESV